MRQTLRLFLTGFSMGAADIVPGVSGGTMAFIFGVYEELIYSIKKLSGETVKLILQRKFLEALKTVPFTFLVPLGLGIVTAIIALSNILSNLLVNEPVYVWSFFFGLIAASIWIIRKRVVTWDGHDKLIFIFAAVLMFFFVGAVPVQTPATLLAFFLSGMIAIVAMILPGISGSFLLVLMGKYEQVLNAVVERDVLTLGAVAIGAVIGLAVFSRILSWLFRTHHDIAIAALSGVMLGSLRKVWPWKDTVIARLDSHGELVPLIERNILPPLNSELFQGVMLAVLAAGILLYIESQGLKEETKDVEDPGFTRKHARALASQKH